MVLIFSNHVVICHYRCVARYWSKCFGQRTSSRADGLTTIQFEFLNQISADSANTIIGLVRDRAATEKKINEELGSRSNVHIIQADITDYDALKVKVERHH